MDAIRQDVVYGTRQLLRRPGITILALITLALGIGANAAIFSVVDTVLLRPLPYAHPERLVQLVEDSKDVPEISISMADINDWRTMNAVFENIAPYMNGSVVLTGMGNAEQLNAKFITSSLVPTLGVQPILGRALTPDDDKVGSAPATLISDTFWARKFAKDPNVIGKPITLDGAIYTIVGVLPSSHFHTSWRRFSAFPSLWRLEDQLGGPQRRDDHPGIYAYALMKPGVTLQQAQSQMSSIAAKLAAEYPTSSGGLKATDATVTTLLNAIVGDVRPGLLVTMATVGFVLLIACANVANLMLARATERHKEMAIRTAFGASRPRLIRQLLTESMVLGLAGGTLGLLAAYASAGVFAKAASSLPRMEDLSIDQRVLLFTLGISLLTALFFGMIPALQASRTDVHDALKEGGRGTSAGAGRKRVRAVLVVAEIAISLVLPIGAGLMIKSLYRVLHADPGFESAGALDTSFSLPATTYKDPVQMRQYVDQVVAKLSAIPGVQAAGYKETLMGGDQDGYVIEGKPEPPSGQEPLADNSRMTTDSFRAMGIRLIRGRFFTDHDSDNAEKVCVIDATMAQTAWPGEDAIGKHLKMIMGAGTQPKWMTVVGIVSHTKNYGVDQPSRVEVYFPFDQWPVGCGDFVIRTAGNPVNFTSAIREAASSVDRDVPIGPLRTVAEIADENVAPRRLTVILLSVFAGLALALAAVGIYGVMSYMVSQRSHEIGIRVALGAESRDVLRLVMGNGMALLAAGLAIGLAGAFYLSRFMASLLFQVHATDAATFAVIPAVLAMVGLAACYFPARRAMRVDPIVALREE